MSGERPHPNPDSRRNEQATTRIATGAPSAAGSALVGGRYALHELLGEGGAARVYRAQDTILGRTVAIKLLREEYGSDPEFVARFYREARAVAALSHPNIVDIYDYGAHDNTYFIAMQYIAGADLKTILHRKGQLTPEQAVAIVDGALRGLGAAHERGIIHRDVKPQNLLVRAEDGLVKLTDFGIARALGGAQVTAAGHTFGTAHYMAPEQASGGELSPATDLYAVGVVLFEALTGRLPFDGDSALQIGVQHLSATPPLVTAFAPGVPLPLTQVVARALAKAPMERFATAAAMRQALHAALPEGPPNAALVAAAAAPTGPTMPLPIIPGPAGQGAPPVPPRFVPTASRRKYLVPALGVLILILLIGIFALARNLTAPAAVANPTATVQAIAIAPTPRQTAPPPTLTATAPAAPTSPPPIAPVVVPPTATAVPPTEEPVPPTPTVPSTVPPTVALVATATALPTATVPAPTATTAPRPPTATATAVPPTPTPGRGNGNGNGNGNDKKLQVPAFDPAQFKGAYRRDDGKLYGLPNAVLYGAGTNYSQGSFAFRATSVPDGALQLAITGLDDERTERCRLQVVLNGTTLFDAADTFPNTPASDNGEGGKARYWGTMTIAVPAGLLREGDNTLVLRNATPGPGIGIPYILINDIAFATGR